MVARIFKLLYNTIKQLAKNRKEKKAMYKILKENVMLRHKGKWYTVKVVLSTCSGGKKVDHITEDGTIIKSEPYCRSKYSKEAKEA
jgi:hypothetical protein